MRSLAVDDVGTTNNREERMGNFTTHIRAASQVGCPTLNTVRSDDLPTLFCTRVFWGHDAKTTCGLLSFASRLGAFLLYLNEQLSLYPHIRCASLYVKQNKALKIFTLSLHKFFFT